MKSNIKIIEQKNVTWNITENNGEYSVHFTPNAAFNQRVLPVFEYSFPQKATRFYGEGANMLSQYYGETAAEISHILPNGLTDFKHYKLPKFNEEGAQVYNLAAIEFSPENYTVIAFTSAFRFQGHFQIFDNKVIGCLDLENFEFEAGKSYELEHFTVVENKSYNEGLDIVADMLCKNHHPLPFKEDLTGWCSWYCYGPNVTSKNIIDTAEVIRQKNLPLRYILLDDGYQKTMGDWLIMRDGFGDLQELADSLKEKGFIPAIWVAPFIASADSEFLKNNPDCFIKDEQGKPLSAADVSFRGWRLHPWYMLDFTNAKTREYISNVFKTFYNMGYRYFKLDANNWGSLPFGTHSQKNVTSVMNYRLGMQTILDSVGKDAFVQGCNAPIWPSIGVVHGMRVSGDVTRKRSTVINIFRELSYRSWMHNKLWVNDPDCFIQSNLNLNIVDAGGRKSNMDGLTDDDFALHRECVKSSGGMVMLSDFIECVPDKPFDEIIAMKDSWKPDDITLRSGWQKTPQGIDRIYFNMSEEPMNFSFDMPKGTHCSEESAKNVTINGSAVTGIADAGKLLRISFINN